MEIKELIRRFIAWRTVAGLSPDTQRGDWANLRIFMRYLEEQGINQIEALNQERIGDFQDYLAFKMDKKGILLRPAYRNTILGSLRIFLRWVKKQDWIAADFSDAIVSVREPQKLPRNILTVEESMQLLMAPDMTTNSGFRDRLLIELMYSTGIRKRELQNLKISSADTSQGHLHIEGGKGGKDRVVPLGPGLCQLIEHYLSRIRPELVKYKYQDAGALFPGLRGDVISRTQFNEIVAGYGAKAGITKPVHPHALRHACATHMLQRGAPIRHVQELLGHASITSTQVYTHVTITDLKKAHAKYHPRHKMKLKDDLPNERQ